jgi:hypothetical protein
MAKSEKRPNRTALLKDIKRVQISLYGEGASKLITRSRYRELGSHSERAWMAEFGTFQEFRRQAEIEPRQQLRKLQGDVKKHSQIDHLKQVSKDRLDWGDKYVRENSSRYQTILGFTDAHGTLVDPFWLRVLIDTAKRVQPDIIVAAGDIYDNPEFSKFFVDPREFDIVGNMKFTNDKIFGPLREACPDAQMDSIEGNHERRILKHITNNSPPTRVFLADWLGLSIPQMLKLDELNINYVAKSDLGAFTKRDEEELLSKNYKVYFDCFLVSHYPGARNKGLPGFNGHHHKHQVWMEYSHHHGPYEWHQVGCGHRRDCVYTDSDYWQNGFLLAHIDTKEKIVNMEYVPVTSMACVGGKYYYREKKEIITPGWK